MDKNSVIRNLLLMHCSNCNGMVFGCRGCTKEEEIRFITSNLEPEEKPVVIDTMLAPEEKPVVIDTILVPEEKPKKKKK